MEKQASDGVTANGSRYAQVAGGAGGISARGVLSAYLLPHPPIIVPEVGHGRENDASSTVQAMTLAGAEIAAARPDVIVLVSPHAPVARGGRIHMSAARSFRGNLRQFGAAGVELSFGGDPGFANSISEAAARVGIIAGDAMPASRSGEGKPASLDHGAMVPLYFIDREYRRARAKAGGGENGSDLPKLLLISVALLSGDILYRFGACVADTAFIRGLRAVFIASGDLSHKLSDDGPYGYNPAGPKFDRHIVDCIRDGNTRGILGIDEGLLEDSAQCGYYGIAMMRGAIERAAELRADAAPSAIGAPGASENAPGAPGSTSSPVSPGSPVSPVPPVPVIRSEVYSYESPFGIGYAVTRSSIE